MNKSSALLSCFIIFLLGCSSSEVIIEGDPTEKKIQEIAILLGRYKGEHQGKAPKDDAAFLKYLDQLPAEQKQSMGFTSADTFLISERDEQPIVILKYILLISKDGMKERH